MGVCTSVGKTVAAFAQALRQGVGAAADEWTLGIPDFDVTDQLNALELPEQVRARARQVVRRAPLSLQLSVCTALEAWRQSGLWAGPIYRPDEISLVIAGQNLHLNYAYDMAEKHRGGLDFTPAGYALHFMDTDHVGAVSEALEIKGEGFTTGAASASGNAGLIQGMRQIQCGRARACVVVGAMMDLSPLELNSLANTGAMATDGICRPFDRDRHGFVYAHGSACLVLEAADGAHARAQRVLGVLRGGAQCLDANRASDPRRDGEARVMRVALADADVQPEDIDYVNAHGTGSVLGDQVEYEALQDVFGSRFPHVWLNSTKAIIGHCLTAAGVVEAAATLIQMNEGFLHATCGLEHPIGDDGRFTGPKAVQADCRIALSNGFGFGGINTAVVIERGSRSA
jgi:malonyl-ACP decarboxylase